MPRKRRPAKQAQPEMLMSGPFDREGYERGLQLFSTLLLRIGIWMSENATTATENEAQKAIAELTDGYIDALDRKDAASLGLMMMSVQSVDWKVPILQISMKLILS